MRNVTCHGCGRQGHIKAVCRSFDGNDRTNHRSVTAVVDESEDESSESNPRLSKSVMSVSTADTGIWHEPCKVNGSTDRFLIDTGSEVTVLPLHIANTIGLTITPANQQSLRAFGGGSVPLVGKVENAALSIGQRTHTTEILITGDNTNAILGMNYLRCLGLLEMANCFPISLPDVVTASLRLKTMLR